MKCKHLIPLLFCFLSLGGTNKLNAQSKTSIGLDLVEDFSSVIDGGITQGETLMGFISLTHETRLWKGASLKGQHVLNHGKPLTDYVGDLQTISNIEAPRNIYLYEFNFEQRFKGHKLIVGKSEINALFAYSTHGMGFIHSSFGIGPEMSVNVPLATFPYAAMGIYSSIRLQEKLHFSAAVFDGSPNTAIGYLKSYDFSLNSKRGLFWIGELDYQITKEKAQASTYKMGVWTLESDSQRESGFYALIDQTLIPEKNDPTQGLHAFAQYGRIPNNASVFSNYKGLGLVYYGAFKKRAQDQTGLAWGQGNLSDTYRNGLQKRSNPAETVIEAYYNYVLSDQLNIQLDAQYIINPGVNTGVKNALIGILRLKYHLF
jgi:porin